MATEFPVISVDSQPVLFVSVILVIFIGFGQGMIFRTVKEKGDKHRHTLICKCQLRHNQKLQEFTVAKQQFLVVMTDFLCCFMIITMGLMALSDVDLGAVACRWSAHMVLPFNSALDPALYSIPETRKRWEDYKEARRQVSRMKVKVNALRRNRFRNKLVAKEVSGRRQLVLRWFHAPVRIRHVMLARPKHVQRARSFLGILYTKMVRMKLIISNK